MVDIIVSGPLDGWEDIQQPLGQRLVSCLKKFGKRIIQAFPDEDHFSSAEWILKRAAAEASKLSVVPDDVVAIFCTNSPHYAPAVIATLCSGAVCAPLCYNMPKDDLSALISKLSPQVIMCTDDNAMFITQLFPSYRIIVLGKSPDTNTSELVQFPLKNYKDKPAFYMFSSGSTGLPKRIALSHRNIDAALNMYRRADSDIYETDILVTATPTFWYTGFIFQLISMDIGTYLVIPQSFNEISYCRTVSKFKGTITFLAPYSYMALCKCDDVHAQMFSSVRHGLTAGASLNAETQEYIQSCLGLNIVQWFGTTEVQLALSYSKGDIPVPIGSAGKLKPWTKAKVLDLESGASVGPGNHGELCFSGPMITVDAASEWFNTGDVAYYDENDFFYVVDRIKEIISYRGIRMSPSELEAAIIQHREVREAAVVGVPHPTDCEHPAALVVRVPEATVSTQELHNFIAEKIHDDNKRLRGGIFFVDSYPKTASGKAKRLEVRKKCIQLVLDLQERETALTR